MYTNVYHITSMLATAKNNVTLASSQINTFNITTELQLQKQT